jgi:hypothetical protein
VLRGRRRRRDGEGWSKGRARLRRTGKVERGLPGRTKAFFVFLSLITKTYDGTCQLLVSLLLKDHHSEANRYIPPILCPWPSLHPQRRKTRSDPPQIPPSFPGCCFQRRMSFPSSFPARWPRRSSLRSSRRILMSGGWEGG